MPSMLERFRRAKDEEIEKLIRQETRGETTPDIKRAKPSFAGALREKKRSGLPAVIAEYKRASPSRGDIDLTLSPEEVARKYCEAGAAAISVLTEKRYFKGELEFLDRMSFCGLPLLRKDFIFHPAQVHATGRTSASAVLVIVRTLDDRELEEILEACSEAGLEAVCEVFSEDDLRRLRAHRVKIVQVNNRDLDTLVTDMGISRRLIAGRRNDELWISASGYEHGDQLDEMTALGFDAFLIGSSLMSGVGGELLATLTGSSESSEKNSRSVAAS